MDISARDSFLPWINGANIKRASKPNYGKEYVEMAEKFSQQAITEDRPLEFDKIMSLEKSMRQNLDAV